MKRVVIHQPDFVPYLGFFERLVEADVFILLDDVQFLRRGWHHRDKIKTPAGARWLTLAVEKGPRDRLLSEVPLVKDPAARQKNVQQLETSYRRAPHFDAAFEAIAATLQGEHRTLVDLNHAFLKQLFEVFAIDCDVVWSSSLGVDSESTQRLVDLVQCVEGSHYLTGTGALDYLDASLFEAATIELEIQSFEHPTYPQLHGEFIPMLSSLDAWLMCGESCPDLLR